MVEIEQIKDFDQIKIVTDPNRLAILRLLMAGPATLTQLGRVMGEHPAWVRHHLKQLEATGLVEMKTAQVSGGFVEKYYQAKARAFYFQEMILPETSGKKIVVMLGSHDLALNVLAQRSLEKTGLQLIIQPVGSLDGLVALRQGIAQISGCHLLDIQSGEYNLPFIRHIFPDRPVVLVTLAHRQQGLLVAPGNPLHIRGLEDLGREDVTLANRNRGSGTRLWLDQQLERMGIPPSRCAATTRRRARTQRSPWRSSTGEPTPVWAYMPPPGWPNWNLSRSSRSVTTWPYLKSNTRYPKYKACSITCKAGNTAGW